MSVTFLLYTIECVPLHGMERPHFISSSVDRYLGFHLLAIMKNVHICVKFLGGYMFLFLLGIYVGVKLLGHMVI